MRSDPGKIGRHFVVDPSVDFDFIGPVQLPDFVLICSASTFPLPGKRRSKYVVGSKMRPGRARPRGFDTPAGINSSISVRAVLAGRMCFLSDSDAPEFDCGAFGDVIGVDYIGRQPPVSGTSPEQSWDYQVFLKLPKYPEGL